MLKLIKKDASGVVFYLMGGEDIADRPGTVVQVKVDDWNRDMSPWAAEKCFKNGEDFGGGAGEFIARLTGAIPEFEAANGIAPRHRALCGYSLAGLGALYGLYLSDMFDGAVSASGSMWFDGWLDFMENARLKRENACIYLSVGDKEAETRNIRLASVEKCMRKAREVLERQGHRAVFFLENGNHFCEPEKRLARGMQTLFEMYGGG